MIDIVDHATPGLVSGALVSRLLVFQLRSSKSNLLSD